MSQNRYLALTFAPVQGFIEKSRKLRDLYGSSFIISDLATAICQAAQAEARRIGRTDDPVISPALPNVTQGTPNQIILSGDLPQFQAESVFLERWRAILRGCRRWLVRVCGDWIEERHQNWVELGVWRNSPSGNIALPWDDDWRAWGSYAWEFFSARGESITAARENLNQAKYGRDWTGTNWIGESSTLSGADGAAYPGMSLWTGSREQGEAVDYRRWNFRVKQEEIREFYDLLSERTNGVVDRGEQLSIPELTKRLVTLEQVARSLHIDRSNIPPSFRDTSTPTAMGWFQGDGDRVGKYLEELKEKYADEGAALNRFSADMMRWGEQTLQASFAKQPGRIIYAGGDDFLGAFYPDENTPHFGPQTCLNWFYAFNREIWPEHGHPLTASVGFVWAGATVPQREVLQHCREAEQAAKQQGRGRLAMRVVFSGGNFLEWVCPWRLLEPIVSAYRDRNNGKNWEHFSSDVASLESRHAFSDRYPTGNPQAPTVAEGLWKLYFKKLSADLSPFDPENWWNADTTREGMGILGERDRYETESGSLDLAKVRNALNAWTINLAKVGVHLCQT